MSAMSESNEHDEYDEYDEEPADHGQPSESSAPAPIVVRRNVALSAPVAAAASAIAIAYLWRASTGGVLLDWILCAATASIAAAYLAGLVDARTPLLVADGLGVRIRLGHQWRGLPWEAVEQVVVEPRHGRLRDGRLVVQPHNLGRALDGLDARARRQAASNRRRYGAALAVPLGLVTRVSSAQEKDIADRVATMSQGRADVVTLVEPVSDATEQAEPAEQVHQQDARHSLAVGLGTIVSRVAKGRNHDVDAGQAAGTVAAAQQGERPGVRADITLAATSTTAPQAVTLRKPPDERGLSRPGSVDLVFEPVPESNVRPIARLGEPVEPLVVDGFETHPAYDPVIGPELVAARHRVGLSVDELAERTRIRPHVIESIEVDDFAPCGGDVYARGHIRTLARVLGKDPVPLLEAFDNRYANAPISARRVFEAELATGMTGSMRSTGGGPNWGLLVGIVLTLVLVWGVVRLFAGSTNEMVENPPPLPDSAAWPSRVYDPPKKAAGVPTVPVKLVALNASTRVQARNANGKVLFAQHLVYGESKTVRLPLPMTLSAANGGALTVMVGRHDYGLLGEADKPATKRFGAGAAE